MSLTAVDEIIVPAWPVPANVHALCTTRAGGVSEGSMASLNLGMHVGDSAAAVARNRALLRGRLPAEPVWLDQVHGIDVIDADGASGTPIADGAVTRQPGVVCCVMTADCLPVLLADRDGTVVGIAHAGWRGLVQGVIEATVHRMRATAGEIIAYLGPAISGGAYEVGAELFDLFVRDDPIAAAAFISKGDGKYWCDLYALARQRLLRIGVASISGGTFCTFRESDRFYSYRRDGRTGRMASCIWLS